MRSKRFPFTPFRTALAVVVALSTQSPVVSYSRASGDGDLRFLAPADGSVLPAGKAIVIGMKRGAGSAIVRVEINGKLKSFTVASNGGIRAVVELEPGKNTIALVAGRDKATVMVSTEGGNGQYRYHPGIERCESCHDPNRADFKPPGTTADLCTSCHRRIDSGKHVHGPVGAGKCAACHEPHGSTRNSLQRAGWGCFGCHEPFPGGGLVHKPAAEGTCNACHNPHSGDRPHRLVREGNGLCLKCHMNVHPRHRTPGTKGTMTKLPEGFPMDGKELACLGCHAPHRSSKPKLLVFTEADPCARCHAR